MGTIQAQHRHGLQSITMEYKGGLSAPNVFTYWKCTPMIEELFGDGLNLVHQLFHFQRRTQQIHLELHRFPLWTQQQLWTHCRRLLRMLQEGVLVLVLLLLLLLRTGSRHIATGQRCHQNHPEISTKQNINFNISTFMTPLDFHCFLSQRNFHKFFN